MHALDAAGKEILTRDFTVSAVMQPYNGVIPRYEQVQVETGWVQLEAGGKTAAQPAHPTDIEELWDHYQNQTLPKVYQFVLSQAHGDLRAEFSPPFDTIKLDIHMSEPDYMPRSRQRAHLLARGAAGRHALLHRRFHEHDGRPGNRPAHHLHRPRDAHRARFRRRARTATCTLSSTASPPPIRWCAWPGPTRRASTTSRSATCPRSPAKCSRA